MSTETNILAARFKAARQRPYLATALWALVLIEEEQVGTILVDQHWRLYYNAEFVNSQTMEALGGLLIHEVWHLLRRHSWRCRVINGKKVQWNIAADMEINDDMREEGITLPDNGIYPDLMGFSDGLLAEEYYRMLEGKVKNIKIELAAGNCGSCAHGQPDDWEIPAEGTDTPCVTETEGTLISREAARQIKEHANRGTMPAGLKRWADAILEPPQVDWRKQLATAIRGSLSTAAGCVDYSYARPSRRQATSQVVLPVMRRPTPEVVCIVDTSYSVNAQQLAVGINEVGGILQAVGTRQTKVLFCDAAAGSIQQISNIRALVPMGGGGTDMRVGFERVNNLRPRPDLVVCITDGETPWPSKPYRFRTVIGLVDNEDKEACPKWATVVIIKSKGDG